MSGDFAKTLYIERYHSVGEYRFYRFLLHYAVSKLIKITNGEYRGTSPEIELLDYSDRFLKLYRREPQEVLLELSRIFRKAAHKIYRLMLKRQMITTNVSFLNVVS
jgi:hypothetical protein